MSNLIKKYKGGFTQYGVVYFGDNRDNCTMIEHPSLPLVDGLKIQLKDSEEYIARLIANKDRLKKFIEDNS